MSRTGPRGAVMVIWLAGLLGCGGYGSGTTEMNVHQGDYPYRVVATVGMVADIARQVAGDRAEVISLIGEGVDPHQHTPTRQDVRQLIDADVVLYAGLMLEGRMEETFEEIRRTGKPVFAVSTAVDPKELLQPPGTEGHYDPHLWMDVDKWIRCVEYVAESLGRYDPTHADEYRSNAEKYVERLRELHAYVQRVIESIPEQQRVLITAHDAFAYFGRAYGIEVMAPQGISTESEASVEDINRLVRVIVDRKVGAIFVESSVNPKNIQAIIEGAADRGHTLEIGGTLYSDAMGAPGTYEGTYIGMIDHNATVIAASLGGDVPAGGFQGRLSGTE